MSEAAQQIAKVKERAAWEKAKALDLAYWASGTAAASRVALAAHAAWLKLHKKLPHKRGVSCRICHPVRR